MVALNRIYTRTGDAGTTGLVGGARRSKADPRIEAIGAVDEANAVIGLARLQTAGGDPGLDGTLARIQNDLFDLGADIATPIKAGEAAGEALRVTDHQVAALETAIDALNQDLAPLRSFVLPGGSAAAVALHLARTAVRSAERRLVAAMAHEPEAIGPVPLRYLNRLSDYLFVAARFANGRGADDVLWIPGANR